MVVCVVDGSAAAAMAGAGCATLARLGLDGKLLCFANIMDEPRGLAAQHTMLSLPASELADEKVG